MISTPCHLSSKTPGKREQARHLHSAQRLIEMLRAEKHRRQFEPSDHAGGLYSLTLWGIAQF
jgi:hypothetical protein